MKNEYNVICEYVDIDNLELRIHVRNDEESCCPFIYFKADIDSEFYEPICSLCNANVLRKGTSMVITTYGECDEIRGFKYLNTWRSMNVVHYKALFTDEDRELVKRALDDKSISCEDFLLCERCGTLSFNLASIYADQLSGLYPPYVCEDCHNELVETSEEEKAKYNALYEEDPETYFCTGGIMTIDEYPEYIRELLTRLDQLLRIGIKIDWRIGGKKR